MTVNSTQVDDINGEAWTVQRVLDWTVSYLKERGSDTPRLDTELLLAHARACSRIELYTHFADVLTDQERAVMRELVCRRAEAEPVAYLIGHREFFGLEFQVTSDVLIPRPDSETLVVELLERAKSVIAPRILDVGTGSGCLAVAAAVQLPSARLTATDIDECALAIAHDNAQRHGVLGRVQLLQSDLLDGLDSEMSFDFVISNPPYIPESEIDTLPPEVQRHEPHLALAGGSDGLVLIRRLIEDAPAYLEPLGFLLIEISPEQASAVCALTENRNAYSEPRVVKDLAGNNRVLVVQKLEDSAKTSARMN